MAELRPGIKVTLAGTEYTVPKWNNRSLRTVIGPIIDQMNVEGIKIDNLTVTDMFEKMPLMNGLYYEALKRNYPEITKEWMEDEFEYDDFLSMMTTMPQLMELNGFSTKAVKPGESQSVGPQ